jgi:hypothetical protein
LIFKKFSVFLLCASAVRFLLNLVHKSNISPISPIASRMNTITITISDEQLLKLQQLSISVNVSIEDLVSKGIENLVSQGISLPNSEKSEVSLEILNKFYVLAKQWENEVEGYSLTTQTSNHPAYQEIIGMGNQVVPLLLKELKNNPMFWLSALNEITGINPIKPEQRGKIKQMAEAWLEWGRNQGYVI